MAYQRRVWLADLGAMKALYGLKTAFLRFQPLYREWTAQQVDALLTEGEPSPDEPGPDADGGSVGEVARRFADCVITCRAYDRFATEVFGVKLATWLGLHSSGPALVEHVGELVTLNPDLCARAEAALREGRIGLAGDDVDSLDDAVDVFYEQVHAEWTDTVDVRSLFG